MPIHPKTRALIEERAGLFRDAFMSKFKEVTSFPSDIQSAALFAVDNGVSVSAFFPTAMPNHETYDKPVLSLFQTVNKTFDGNIFLPFRVPLSNMRIAKAVRSSPGLIRKFKSTPESVIGKPLIRFDFGNQDQLGLYELPPYRKAPLLLTTTGIYGEIINSKVRHIPWEAMDFVASSDLVRDDTTFYADRDESLLWKCVQRKRFTWPAILVWLIVLLGSYYLSSSMFKKDHEHSSLSLILMSIAVFCVVLFPLAILLIRYVMVLAARFHLRWRFRSNKSRQNILFINHFDMVDIGVTDRAEGIILCLKLGLTIYRLQQEKYGKP
jgi:hypothetical protein